MKTRSQTRIESYNINSFGNTVECAICLQDVKHFVKTKCKHLFCDLCLMQHLLRNRSCPLCRTICDPNFIIEQIGDSRQTTLLRKLELNIFNSKLFTNITDENVYNTNNNITLSNPDNITPPNPFNITPPNPVNIIFAEMITIFVFILQVNFIIISIYYTIIHVRQYIEGKPVYTNNSIDIDYSRIIEYPNIIIAPKFDFETFDITPLKI